MRPHTLVLSLTAMGIAIVLCGETVKAQQVAAPVTTETGVRQFLQPSNVHEIRNSEILGIPTSHCGHVIDLLTMTHLRQQTGQVGDGEVCLPHLTAGLKPGDLELLCVNLVCEGDACRGPVFQISMKNSSCVPIGNFKVSIVAVLCQIQVHSPTATVCIPRMEPGEETAIQIQLPVTCMTMGPVGQLTEFDTLVVAVDSFDDLLECNELNNVLILKRAEIGVLVAETTTPAAPVEATPVDPAPADPGLQPDTDDSSPTDEIDLDSLDLSSTQSLQIPGT